MSIDATLRSVGQFARCQLVPALVNALGRAGDEDSGWGIAMPLRRPDLRTQPPPPGCVEEPASE